MRFAVLVACAALPLVAIAPTAQAQIPVTIKATCRVGNAASGPVIIRADIHPSTVGIGAQSQDHINWHIDNNSHTGATVTVRPEDGKSWPFTDTAESPPTAYGGDHPSGPWDPNKKTWPPLVHYIVKVTCKLPNGATSTAEFDPDVTIDPGASTQGKKPAAAKADVKQPATKKP
jgi:hypothetical protein